MNDRIISFVEMRSNYIRYFGGGTQRWRTELNRLFPNATTVRMDMDTTGKKQSHEEDFAEV